MVYSTGISSQMSDWAGARFASSMAARTTLTDAHTRGL